MQEAIKLRFTFIFYIALKYFFLFTGSQITRFESLKEQYKEFSKKHQTLMYKIKSLEKCKIQSVASDCNPFNDTSIFYDFDNSLYLTKGPLSAKDYIVSFKER